MLFLKQGFIILSMSAPKRSLVLIFYRILQCMNKLLKLHFIKCCIVNLNVVAIKNNMSSGFFFFYWWAEYVMVRIFILCKCTFVFLLM